MSKAALAFGYKKVPDLPKYRCTEAPSLTHYGVDMFGPFVILERRSDQIINNTVPYSLALHVGMFTQEIQMQWIQVISFRL